MREFEAKQAAANLQAGAGPRDFPWKGVSETPRSVMSRPVSPARGLEEETGRTKSHSPSHTSSSSSSSSASSSKAAEANPTQAEEEEDKEEEKQQQVEQVQKASTADTTETQPGVSLVDVEPSPHSPVRRICKSECADAAVQSPPEAELAEPAAEILPESVAAQSPPEAELAKPASEILPEVAAAQSPPEAKPAEPAAETASLPAEAKPAEPAAETVSLPAEAKPAEPAAETASEPAEAARTEPKAESLTSSSTDDETSSPESPKPTEAQKPSEPSEPNPQPAPQEPELAPTSPADEPELAPTSPPGDDQSSSPSEPSPISEPTGKKVVLLARKDNKASEERALHNSAGAQRFLNAKAAEARAKEAKLQAEREHREKQDEEERERKRQKQEEDQTLQVLQGLTKQASLSLEIQSALATVAAKHVSVETSRAGRSRSPSVASTAGRTSASWEHVCSSSDKPQKAKPAAAARRAVPDDSLYQ